MAFAIGFVLLANYQVTSDSYFVLPPGVPHEYGADSEDPWTIYWVHYRGTMAGTLLPSTHGPVEVRPGQSSHIARILHVPHCRIFFRLYDISTATERRVQAAKMESIPRIRARWMQ